MQEDLRMDICKILQEAKTVAVVGFSKNPNRASREIASYLAMYDFNVVGINPDINDDEVGGVKVYRSLKDFPGKIDIVDVFRKPEAIPEIIPDVLEVNPGVLWLQLGIRNDDAVKPAQKKGITVIQDKCIKIEHTNCLYR
jgi:predicted CoA-binding protein